MIFDWKADMKGIRILAMIYDWKDDKKAIQNTAESSPNSKLTKITSSHTLQFLWIFKVPYQRPVEQLSVMM